MGRRPVEDDPEEREGGQLDGVGDRGPSDERRHGPRGPSDHDVLRSRTLHPERVDEDVEQEGRGRQCGRQRIDG